ncbi:MAG: amino acid permease [Rhizobiales bacterium]|nr:amino acid permease [Hyphomicrobiales bacterium]
MSNPASGGASAAKVSLVTATAIVVADMVGVGVFTSLGFQVKDITSGFSILLLWIVGGVVAMCGAISYAELASMFPRSSGEYNFLRRAYHPALGFLAGWLSGTVGFAAPIALAAMAFGVYFKSIAPSIPPLLSGLILICAVSLVHLRGIHHISLFQNLWTALKIGMIVVFIFAGFALGKSQPVSFVPGTVDFTHIVSAPFFISLVFVMYSYSGWNAATYIIGELRDPDHVLPRALFFGTLIVIVLYVMLNAVFLFTTPISALSGQLDVAMVAGTSIFGEFGGRIVAGLICLGLISSVSAMVWIGPRVTMTMGEDMPLLRFFAQKSKTEVPARAILLQLTVATVLLLSQSFEAVLDFIQFSLTLSSFMTVLGVIVLRIRKPAIPRPYRAWGYPVTPLIFLTVMLFMMYYLITNRPLQSLAGLGIMLAGLAIYAMSHLFSNAPSSDSSRIS